MFLFPPFYDTHLISWFRKLPNGNIIEINNNLLAKDYIRDPTTCYTLRDIKHTCSHILALACATMRKASTVCNVDFDKCVYE